MHYADRILKHLSSLKKNLSYRFAIKRCEIRTIPFEDVSFFFSGSGCCSTNIFKIRYKCYRWYNILDDIHVSLSSSVLFVLSQLVMGSVPVEDCTPIHVHSNIITIYTVYRTVITCYSSGCTCLFSEVCNTKCNHKLKCKN